MPYLCLVGSLDPSTSWVQTHPWVLARVVPSTSLFEELTPCRYADGVLDPAPRSGCIEGGCLG
jgi:hypothetical protein